VKVELVANSEGSFSISRVEAGGSGAQAVNSKTAIKQAEEHNDLTVIG
jgi:hypothetical protein